MESEYVQVTTSFSNRDEAQELADALLDRRLAACVQIHGPVQSTYRWEGRVERSEEWLCHIKTSAACYPTVENMIRDTHTYEEPEILALPVLFASHSYLQWMRESLEEPTMDTAPPQPSWGE